MRLRATLAALATVVAAVLVVAPIAPAASPATTTPATTPITGTLPGGGTFNGTFDVQKIVAQNGQLAAVGTLTGTLTDVLGNVIGTVDQLVTVPLTASGTCQILNLTLGPLDLNLLGLQVHLNQVLLDISAQSGPGNLLGNLLCGISHLLDSNAAAGALANGLNRILGL